MAYRIIRVQLLPKRTFSSRFFPVEKEYTDEAIYPPIINLSRQSVKDRRIDGIAQHITSLPTVEEKLIELNAPKYYGWWSSQLQEAKIPYNALPFIQFATRSTIEKKLPSLYSELDDAASKYCSNLKDKVQNVILQELEYGTLRTNRHGEFRSKATREERTIRNFVPQLNRLLISALSPNNNHLTTTEIDLQPRVEAFWSLGGIEPDKQLRKSRKENDYFRGKEEDPIDRPMQYRGKPCLSLRNDIPLPQFIDRNSGLSIEGDIPQWSCDPRVLGYKYKLSRASNTPGFWPNDCAQHGYLSVLSQSHMRLRDEYLNHRDHQEGLDAQAILHSFASTLGQACYLGFGPYTELTYPITTQTIITNGQDYSFYAYQLNTCALYQRFSGDANPHRNVCFSIDEMKLFETIENDQVKGFNEDVLKNLIKFYLMKPVEPNYELRPYLSPERYISNTADAKKRTTIDKNFKYLMSNRPRHLLADELLHWEKIYKVDHQTRPMEAKRRFFEVGKHPGVRRLDEFNAPYVPKALREVPKKSRRGRLPEQPTIKL